MAEIINLVNQINDSTTLEQIKICLDQKINKIKSESKINEISEEIKINGYCLSINNIKPNQFNVLILKYYVDVMAFDKEDKSDPKITGTSYKQKPWTKLLNFKYDADEEDNLIDLNDEWDYGDRDSPATTIGYIHVYLYFQELKTFLNGNFKIINEDGVVQNWSNIDGIIKVIGTSKVIEDEIKDLDIFIKV